MPALSTVQDIMAEATPFWKVPQGCVRQGRKGAFSGHRGCPDPRTRLSKEGICGGLRNDAGQTKSSSLPRHLPWV